jgi:ribonuclease inhibitor
MIEIIIDGKDLKTKQQAHDFFSQQQGFPARYGKNLDALFDVLTSMPEVKVTVKDPQSIVDNLGEYGKKLLLVIKDACDRNPGILLEATDGEDDAEAESESCDCGCDDNCGCECDNCDCEDDRN